MRFVAVLCLLGACTYDYWPEPRGPRTVCSGMAVNEGYYAAGTGSCQQYPADPCWNNASSGCRARVEQIREHNTEVHARETRDWLVAGGVLIGAVIVSALVVH